MAKKIKEDPPYARFVADELILRDELAVDRTVMANERTFLSYSRTALALLLAGVTFLHFSEAIWYSIIGAASLPVGMVIFLVGLARYRRLRREIRSVRKRLAAATGAPELPVGSEPADSAPASR